jgi:hypothetical protein
MTRRAKIIKSSGLMTMLEKLKIDDPILEIAKKLEEIGAQRQLLH